jgi:hypothetical protein
MDLETSPLLSTINHTPLFCAQLQSQKAPEAPVAPADLISNVFIFGVAFLRNRTGASELRSFYGLTFPLPLPLEIVVLYIFLLLDLGEIEIGI